MIEKVEKEIYIILENMQRFNLSPKETIEQIKIVLNNNMTNSN